MGLRKFISSLSQKREKHTYNRIPLRLQYRYLNFFLRFRGIRFKVVLNLKNKDTPYDIHYNNPTSSVLVSFVIFIRSKDRHMENV